MLFSCLIGLCESRWTWTLCVFSWPPWLNMHDTMRTLTGKKSSNKVWLNKTQPGSEAPTCNLSPWEVKAVGTEVQGQMELSRPCRRKQQIFTLEKMGEMLFCKLTPEFDFFSKITGELKAPWKTTCHACTHPFIRSLAPHKLKFNIVPSSCLSQFWIGVGRLSVRFVGLGQSVWAWLGSSL